MDLERSLYGPANWKISGKYFMEKLSVVIPCYKSESMIRTVVQETVCALVKRPEYTYEIILVNDGSPDGTWRELQQLARGQ